MTAKSMSQYVSLPVFPALVSICSPLQHMLTLSLACVGDLLVLSAKTCVILYMCFAPDILYTEWKLHIC